jgi:hypothetical protein
MIASLLVIAAVLLGLHLPVFLFLWARFRQVLAFHQLALGACLGACAQAVLTMYALSLVRWLTPTLWLALNLAAACGWIIASACRGFALGELKTAIAERLALVRQLPRRPALVAVALLSAIGVAWLLTKAWIYPIYDWDGAQAHFAIAREMLQERGAPLQFAPIPRITYATFVPHIFYAVTLSLPHGYEWVNGTNIYFLLLAAFAQYCFVRRLGLHRSTALLVSPAVLLCPVLFQQATTGYVDLTAAAFIGAILPFVPTRRESSTVEFALASTALGLAVGSKESMLLLLPLMGLALVIWTWRLRPRGGLNRLAAPVAIMMTAVVLLGGYRYLSNTRLHHNPIFPSDMKLLGVHLRGVGDTGVAAYGALYGHPVSDAYKSASPLGQVWMSWREENQYTIPFPYCSDNALGGLGPLWFVLFLPAIAVALFFARRGPWLLALAVFAAYLVIMPDARSLARYVAFIFLLGPPAYALVGEGLSRAGNALWKGLLIAGLVFALFENVPFQQDPVANWFRTLRLQDPSARFYQPSPAAQFLRDVPGDGETVGVTLTNIKKLFCWNGNGSDRIQWIVDRSWFKRKPRRLSVVDLGPEEFLKEFPDPPQGEALYAAISDPRIDYLCVPPAVSQEIRTRSGYLLAVPLRPASGSFMTAESPAAIWVRAR